MIRKNFCNSRVNSLKTTRAVFADVFWYLVSVGTLSGSSFFNFEFIISSDGWKGQSEVLKKTGTFSHDLSKRASADRPRAPASAGLPTVGTWFHSSTVVSSSVWATQLVTDTGCLSMEYSQRSTLVLFVHNNVRSTVGVSAFRIPFFNRAARRAA